MNLKKYLEQIQQDESIFPVDSLHKKKEPLRVFYPEQATVAEENHKRVMIDFDKTISDYRNGWNGGKLTDEEPISGAKEALDELHRRGIEIFIFTTRASKRNNGELTSKLIADLKGWLNKYDIYYDGITGEKLAAMAYVDDRAIRFGGNWRRTLEEVLEIVESEEM